MREESAAWRACLSGGEQPPSENSSPFRHRVTLPGQALAIGGPFQKDRWAGLPMPNSRPAPAAPANRLLARLPEADRSRLLPLLQPVTLTFEQVLYESRGPIDHAYFPTGAVCSALTIMQDG